MMAEIRPTKDELRIFMQELLENSGFTPTQISTVVLGMDAIEEYSNDLGELSDAEQTQLSTISSPMMAMLTLELAEHSPLRFEESYALLGDLLGEVVRAIYQVGKLKGRSNGRTEDA